MDTRIVATLLSTATFAVAHLLDDASFHVQRPARTRGTLPMRPWDEGHGTVQLGKVRMWYEHATAKNTNLESFTPGVTPESLQSK